MSKLLFCMSIVMILSVGCQSDNDRKTIREYPIDNTSRLPISENIVFDSEVSADSNGSLSIYCNGPNRIRLFETGDVNIEDGKLVYSADIKTELTEGSVFLEMWCVFGKEGEYFSRGINSKVSGFTDWQENEIYFFLKEGENPDNIRLNIMVEGKGKVWIDDIKLEI